MAVYDCLQYFNEDHVLDLRFNILNEKIDFFVISESKKNHQGKEKKLNFDIKNFSKFKKKIIYLVADPKEDLIIENHKYGHSLIEQHQRNFITNGLKKANENDLILLSDSDEIPNLDKLNLIKKKYFAFSQKSFCYKLNVFNPHENNWIGTRGCLKKNLKTPQHLRNMKFKKYPFWRIDKRKLQIIDNGGWHFSYLLNLEKISEKIKSFSHSEDNTEENTEIQNIQKKINSLIHPTKNYKLKKINLDETFPKFIKNNQARFDKWIVK